MDRELLHVINNCSERNMVCYQYLDFDIVLLMDSEMAKSIFNVDHISSYEYYINIRKQEESILKCGINLSKEIQYEFF